MSAVSTLISWNLPSTGAEVYGGQNISHIEVSNGQTLTLPIQ